MDQILEEIFLGYSLEKKYECSTLTSYKGFTKLMVIIINTGKYPILNTIIHEYIDIINDKNKRDGQH